MMALGAVATNLITLTILSYSSQRQFRQLPGEVQELLQEGKNPGLPFAVSVALNARLQAHHEIVVSLTPDTKGFVLRSVEPGQKPLEVHPQESPSHPPVGFGARLQQSLWFSTLFSGLLGIALALGFSGHIARPLQSISSVANRLAQGQLGARVPDLVGDDEVAMLGRSFNRMAQQLEQHESERRAMFADIAHELRTPLGIMQARLEAIQDGVINLEMAEVDRLHHQTGYLSHLIEDLRTLSLADAGKLVLERTPCDLRTLIQEVSTSFQAKADCKQVRLEVGLPEYPLNVQVDSLRLAQVLGNLLNNAIAFTPEGGVIRVQALKDTQGIRFSITDTGPGIPKEALPKVFDRFYRGEAWRSRKTGGSGLGLSIVKTIVHLHGGTVEVHNRPSGGAEFRVRLPV